MVSENPYSWAFLAKSCKRREFITLVGGAAAAWPLTARAQSPALPVIGYLGTESANAAPDRVREFLQGLRERGYIEGRNVAIEYRWADGHNERLPALAAELVQRQVALIAANGAAALAAKAATTTIPIVFYTGGDPVQIGLVPSLNRPGGNVTGVTDLNVGVGSKRLELLRELVPTATTIGVLVNPANRTRAETVVRELEGPAQALQLKLHVLNAGNDRDLDAAFENLAQLRLSGLVVGADAFFASRSKRLGELAARHGVPAIFAYREFAASGGLLSYGANNTELYRQVGIYSGRILKGEKPAAYAFDLTGTWTEDESNCGKVFVKKNSKISMTRNADAFGGGFIVEGNQIRGQTKTCKIAGRKEDGGVLHLIAACSTDIAVLGTQELTAKINNDNQITRIFSWFPEMGTTYFRCRL